MRFICFYVLFFITFCVYSQKATISGYVEDEEWGEELIGATVYNGKTRQGVSTNYFGFYSLTFPVGEIELHYSYVGYPEKVVVLNLLRDTVINMKMLQNVEIEEVVVQAKGNDIIDNAQMSMIELPMSQLDKMPTFMGETDVLKVVQLMPGVQSGSEGSSGLYVRGGGPDQNLFLFDGVPVYNASHLFGFFSVFNADAIKNVTLYKGGFPARFGGRLSSVVDIRMKEGNNKNTKGVVSIGLISSKLTLEGPLFNEKTTYIISGRRTYIDVLARPVIKTMSSFGVDVGYYFYDFNGKVTHTFSDTDKVFVSFYRGKDIPYMFLKEQKYVYGAKINKEQKQSLGWGNYVGSVRWNHVYGPALFANTTATFSDFEFFWKNEIKEDYQDWDSTSKYVLVNGLKSGIRDYSLGHEVDWMPNPNHSLKFGIKGIYHIFSPHVEVFEFDGNANIKINQESVRKEKIYAYEYNAYAEDDAKFGNRLSVHYGLHLSAFQLKERTYAFIEPRIAARYKLNKKVALKASYAEMNQYLHLLQVSKIELPFDKWLPATEDVKPQNSKQLATGVAYAINNEFDFSAEVFYKEMYNLLEYKSGVSVMFGTSNWSEIVEKGNGLSYGLELFLQKSIGKTTGWIGYTLSKSERQYDNINYGKPYPYRYDRRHDVSFTLVHTFSKKVDVGVTWVFGTGNAVSLAYERYVALPEIVDKSVSNNYHGALETIDNYEMRNNFRMPSYHRLDICLNHYKQVKWGDRVWSFGLYNAYSRKNPFLIMMDTEVDYYSGNTKSVIFTQISLFPILPSISYTLKFEGKKFSWSDFKEIVKDDF